MSVVLKFGIIPGSFGLSYTLIEFLVMECAEFNFELQALAPVHQTLLKNSMCVLG